MMIRIYTKDGKHFETENYTAASDVWLLIRSGEAVNDRRTKTIFNADNVVAVQEER